MLRGLVLSLACVASAGAQNVCDPAKFQGSYGFLLTGRTTISGDSKAVASAGSLTFDGNGGVSGKASVNFAGYLLGNPVTGSYEARADCTVNWKLQDDSGAYQNFTGKFTSGWSRAEFRQTESAASDEASSKQNRYSETSGTIAAVSSQCAATSLAPLYSFSISGSTTPMNPGDDAHTVRAAGRMTQSADGGFAVSVNGGAPYDAKVQVDSDCVVQLSIPLQTGIVNLRGVLVGEGKEILAIATDPGAAITARFSTLNVSTEKQY